MKTIEVLIPLALLVFVLPILFIVSSIRLTRNWSIKWAVIFLVSLLATLFIFYWVYEFFGALRYG